MTFSLEKLPDNYDQMGGLNENAAIFRKGTFNANVLIREFPPCPVMNAI